MSKLIKLHTLKYVQFSYINYTLIKWFLKKELNSVFFEVT